MTLHASLEIACLPINVILLFSEPANDSTSLLRRTGAIKEGVMLCWVWSKVHIRYIGIFCFSFLHSNLLLLCLQQLAASKNHLKEGSSSLTPRKLMDLSLCNLGNSLEFLDFFSIAAGKLIGSDYCGTSAISIKIIHILILCEVLKLATHCLLLIYVQFAIDVVAIYHEYDQK